MSSVAARTRRQELLAHAHADLHARRLDGLLVLLRQKDKIAVKRKRSVKTLLVKEALNAMNNTISDRLADWSHHAP